MNAQQARLRAWAGLGAALLAITCFAVAGWTAMTLVGVIVGFAHVYAWRFDFEGD